MTGGLVWKTDRAVKNGGKVSDAPIYVNGIVLAGDSCGRQRRQQPVDARLHADNGRALWTWSPIPRPGSPATTPGRTTARAATAALYGGGSFWESPLVDTKRNLAIFGTGNPEPWNSRGPGMNLYTDSIVALNLYTGQLKWYFQQVHHDMWDSDLPNNGVMFDGKFKIDGKRSHVPPSPMSTRSA